MVKHTLDQVLEFRLNGWEAKEFIYLAMINAPFLEDQIQITTEDNYHGLHGMSLIILCDQYTANRAYAEADKMLACGLLNLGIWHIRLPHIAELVVHGHRYQTPRVMPLSPEWAGSVKRLAEAA